MTIPGIDVSNWQGRIHWADVAASGVQFAFAKSTEGTSYTDPWCYPNLLGMEAAGIARGVYHFARPDINSALAEAEYFCSRLGWLSDAERAGLVVALDLEVGYGDLANWSYAWLDEVSLALGCPPMIYSSAYFLEAHGIAGDSRFSDNGLWLAAWQPSPPASVPAPWPFWAVWQYSDSGSVPGIAGPVDLNQFNGDVAQFRAYGAP